MNRYQRVTTFAALGLAIGAVAYAQAQQIGADDLLRGLGAPSRWLIHSGDYTSKRHSPLTQITPENVARLTPLWTFEAGVGSGFRDKFEATPIAIDGTLYVTGLNNHAWAIDGRTGALIWHYQRKFSSGLRVCCGMVNRGFAVSGDRLYMTTLDAHVMALDRKTGNVIWDVPMAEARLGYSSTVAPLVVKDKLIVGMAGGELATRGFLDAYSLDTGKRLWRFNTVPAPGEPGGDTWPSGHFERGGGATWITGSYDPDLNLLYWGIGNPNPLFYGGIRNGDNLYTASVVALDADTGRLRWHFQYTPHDEHDWDSNQVQVLADLTIGGRARKTLITANRNGFFYVLDRTSGTFIQAKPYVTTTWARDVDGKGRPIELPNQRPTPEGTRTCPDLAGGSSFTSPSFDPVRRLFFVSARETCQVFTSSPPAKYELGDFVTGGGSRERGGTGALRAIDPVTLERKWEVPYGGPSYSGVLSTASGLVFAGDHAGTLMGVKSETGQVLWRHRLPGTFWGAPSTVMVDKQQLLLMASGQTLTAFALASPAQAPGPRAVLDIPDEAFEVASVKPNRSGREQWEFDTPPGRVVGTNVVLRDLIRFAYYIFGGDFDLRIDAPNWIKTARFDLEGTTRGVVSQARAMAMLRHLLADRFALKVHYEAREQPAFAMVMVRGDRRPGPSLKANPTDCAKLSAANDAARAAGAAPVITLDPDKRPICGTRGGPGTITSGALTMEQLALQLARNVGRPVVDRTGLKGGFDWDLRWAPDHTSSDPAAAGASGPSIFTALQEQLGLKLEATTAPIEVLVVDRIEQPTQN